MLFPGHPQPAAATEGEDILGVEADGCREVGDRLLVILVGHPRGAPIAVDGGAIGVEANRFVIVGQGLDESALPRPPEFGTHGVAERIGRVGPDGVGEERERLVDRDDPIGWRPAVEAPLRCLESQRGAIHLLDAVDEDLLRIDGLIPDPEPEAPVLLHHAPADPVLIGEGCSGSRRGEEERQAEGRQRQSGGRPPMPAHAPTCPARGGIPHRLAVRRHGPGLLSV